MLGFKQLLTALFSGSEPEQMDNDGARLALCALLVRIARADGIYDADEAAHIARVVSARYGLTEHQAIDLRSEAEALEAEAPDTVRFTRAIKDAVPYEERVGVIVALWEVALADGVRDAEEDAVIRLVSGLLGVSDQDSARARQQVEREG